MAKGQEWSKHGEHTALLVKEIYHAFLWENSNKVTYLSLLKVIAVLFWTSWMFWTLNGWKSWKYAEAIKSPKPQKKHKQEDNSVTVLTMKYKHMCGESRLKYLCVWFETQPLAGSSLCNSLWTLLDCVLHKDGFCWHILHEGNLHGKQHTSSNTGSRGSRVQFCNVCRCFVWF